jgi:hypothetical protein
MCYEMLCALIDCIATFLQKNSSRRRRVKMKNIKREGREGEE